MYADVALLKQITREPQELILVAREFGLRQRSRSPARRAPWQRGWRPDHSGPRQEEAESQDCGYGSSRL